ncbi:YrhK-like protein [Actinopolyspora lacussalsi subsp. righensis]|uniref:YrhK-like protein n=1 Tax=Actinopolyspora righensis TaxID=995060 RepID=A0A1I6Y6X4_9ACTN|nr:YrhK family protein [Actinopolyspora righensis]SFT46182.1 YrhK-like protein [Actinopolyspora righensis]
MHESDPSSSTPLVLRIGHEELLIRKRYEVISIANDILIALWFMVGSILFFWEATTTEGTWLFLIGSIELAIRPAIRLSRRVHLRRLRGRPSRHDNDSEQDF